MADLEPLLGNQTQEPETSGFPSAANSDMNGHPSPSPRGSDNSVLAPSDRSTNAGEGVLSLGSLLSSLSSLQHARLGVPAEHDGQGGGSHISVPRIQLRITSGNSLAGSVTNEPESTASGGSSGRAVQQGQGGSLSRALLRHLSRNAGRTSTSDPTSTGPEPSTADTNVAAAAERHRLNNTTVVDLQATARWLESSLCFFGLLLLVFLYNHIAGIATFAWLTVVLVRGNDLLRKQVALKEQRKLSQLLAMAAALAWHVVAVLWVTKGDKLWDLLIFVPPKTLATVWDTFYAVAVVDVLVRYVSMVLKVCLLLVTSPSSPQAFRRRGQLLTFLEHFVLLYRAAIPTPVWYKYYDTRKMPSLLFSLCTGMYMMCKCSVLYERLTATFTSFKTVLHPEGQYGHYATADEVAETGNQCAICQEPMSKPIKLQCTHIFCEACIAEWFERERTCPMCRAVVKPTGLPSFGDCSTSLLPQLF